VPVPFVTCGCTKSGGVAVPGRMNRKYVPLYFHWNKSNGIQIYEGKQNDDSFFRIEAWDKNWRHFLSLDVNTGCRYPCKGFELKW